jgi:hypothetical protein
VRTVHKFELETVDLQVIETHKKAKLLYVATQRGKPCLWAQVDTDQPMARRMVATHGTGHPIVPHNTLDGLILPKYVGTYQLMEGALILHVFDHGET